MAGIVGYIGESIACDDPKLIDRMIEEIKYVGSNAVDLWNKDELSIARVHHGVVNPEKQPIFNEDKSLFIFMDGEVYDYQDEKQFLLRNGHRFQYEQNDAEFCLHLFEELGEESFVKLNGSFLIGIYDSRNKELILVNDRFSSCPLFYFSTKESLIFGTQLKPILQSGKVPRNLDSHSVMEFFTFQRVLGNKTYYKDIEVMSPATILRLQNGKIGFQEYWEMNYQEDYRKSKDYYVDALADTLKKSVKRRTSDNRRYGILLSGGLDSRTVLAASDSTMTAFTIANFENREVKIAKRISNEKGCRNIFIKRDPNHYANILENAVQLGDGMYRFDHAHFVGFFDRIKEECDILLHGCALGALFKGAYLPGKSFQFWGKNISLPIIETISEGGILETILGKLLYSLWDKKPGRIFRKEFCIDVEAVIYESVNSIIEESRKHARNCYNQYEYFVFYFLFKHFTFLNELCIRPFIEERRVVLDTDLFDLYLEMPPELRFNGRIFKKALNRIDPKIARIPNANTGVSPVVPEYIEWGIEIGEKLFNKVRPGDLSYPFDTQGSWPNRSELIRHNEKMKQLIWDIIHDEESIDTEIFNKSALIDVFDQHMKYQNDFTWFLYLVLTFGVWYKKYGPR